MASQDLTVATTASYTETGSSRNLARGSRLRSTYNARMTAATFPPRMLLLIMSGWVNRHQRDVIAYEPYGPIDGIRAWPAIVSSLLKASPEGEGVHPSQSVTSRVAKAVSDVQGHGESRDMTMEQVPAR